MFPTYQSIKVRALFNDTVHIILFYCLITYLLLLFLFWMQVSFPVCLCFDEFVQSLLQCCQPRHGTVSLDSLCEMKKKTFFLLKQLFFWTSNLGLCWHGAAIFLCV